MESTLAGWASVLFSATNAAAVTCAIMNPELSPGFGVRNAGRPENAGSTRSAILRSASSRFRKSRALSYRPRKRPAPHAKLPPDSASSVSAKMSGLSDTPLASMRRVAAAWRRRSRQAPMTCGWQRRQSGSWTRSSPAKCEARMALPTSSARKAAATSICPAWRLSAWMRASNGVSDPRAPSVDRAPVAKAEPNSVSALNRPTSAFCGRRIACR